MIHHVVLVPFVPQARPTTRSTGHPAHEAVIRERIGPIRAGRVAIQFER